MLAKEVKRIIRSVFEPACRDHGFRRTKRGGIGWYHPVDNHYFVITFRTPRQWNRHWGGFVECTMRVQDQINPWIPEFRHPMERSIVSLASDAERETIRSWYNEAAARTTIPDETSDHLTIMERELSEMLRVPLDGPLSAEYVRFWRGMIEEVHCSADRFLKVGTRILETFPLVNVLSLHKVRGRGKRLAESSEFSAMRSLKMMHLADDDWQWIVRSAHLGRVEKLCVAFPRPIDLAWLLDMPLARQLRVLDLTGSRLDANVLALFGDTDAVSRLETLVLSDTGMDDEMARRLSEVATFRDLKRLSVDDNAHLGIEGIASILQAEFAPRLELLAVGSGWPDDYRAQHLAESHLSSTIHLSMKHGLSGLDKEAFERRFPNCSFGQDLIARYL